MNSKELARAYMQQRLKAKTPPPSREEIRRQLGWPLSQQQQGTR